MPGKARVIASAPGFNSAQAMVVVEVPNLGELPADPSRYVLVGAPNNSAATNDQCRQPPPTSKHFQNHFAVERLRNAVIAIADAMLRETGILLRVNDMSLPLGGLFDIDNDWAPPHESHRVGLNADIGFRGIRGGACIPYNKDRLKEAILEVTKRVPLEHPANFHVRVQ